MTGYVYQTQRRKHWSLIVSDKGDFSRAPPEKLALPCYGVPGSPLEVRR